MRLSKQTSASGEHTIAIHAPYEQLEEAVFAIQRRVPTSIEFVGFDPCDGEVEAAIAMARQTGHQVRVRD